MESMRLATLTKLSLGATVLVGVASVLFAFQRDRFPGIPVDDSVVALIGGRIYDPAGDSVIHDATVIIRGRTISAVGREVSIPGGARSLNVSGLTLLPGFIDSHVHLSGIRAVPEGGRRISALRYLWLFTRRFPERRRDLIAAGVTSVKSLGDPHPWILRLAASVADHELGGPRIFAAGPMITTPGGHPVAALRASGQGDTSFIAQVARQVVDPAAAETAVNGIAGGVDFISAVLETPGDAGLPRLDRATLRAITRVAHARALDVLVHISSARDVRTSLAAAADGIEHTPTDGAIEPDMLARLRSANVFVDPTLMAVEQRAAAAPGGAARRAARANVLRLRRAGVPIVVGSDAPYIDAPFGESLHVEMRGLVEVGYTPREVITAATWLAAEHMGVADLLGTIEPGKWADIVAVAGDPLNDIYAAADTYLVIADGQPLLDRLEEVRRPGGVLARAARGQGEADAPREVRP